MKLLATLLVFMAVLLPVFAFVVPIRTGYGPYVGGSDQPAGNLSAATCPGTTLRTTDLVGLPTYKYHVLLGQYHVWHQNNVETPEDVLKGACAQKVELYL